MNKSSNINHSSSNTHIKKTKLNKSIDDEQDGLLFSVLLNPDNIQKEIIVSNNQQQSLNNQKEIAFEDNKKQENTKIDTVNDSQSKNIADIQQAEKTHTTEFCKALQENHDKHNFEVNMPKLGTFRISTEKTGQKLHFSVSSKEKIAHDWLKTHQSSIEQNVGQDLNMDVSLGISYAV